MPHFRPFWPFLPHFYPIFTLFTLFFTLLTLFDPFFLILPNFWPYLTIGTPFDHFDPVLTLYLILPFYPVLTLLTLFLVGGGLLVVVGCGWCVVGGGFEGISKMSEFLKNLAFSKLYSKSKITQIWVIWFWGWCRVDMRPTEVKGSIAVSREICSISIYIPMYRFNVWVSQQVSRIPFCNWAGFSDHCDHLRHH